MLDRPLAVLQPLGWLLLIAGAGLLLVQSRLPIARRLSRETKQGVKRATDLMLSTNPAATVANPDTREDNANTGERAIPTAPTRWGRDVFELIEWRRFEAVIEMLFAKAGFETRSQSHGADGGVDVWLYARSDTRKPAGIVQCKHWVGKRIGADKVRELKGVMASHAMTRGHFATTSTFTPDAIEFARQNGIHLLDIEGILRLIDKRPQEDQAALLAVATEGEFWKPTCVNCGRKLVARTGRSSGKPFWGCPSFPRCRTTMPMRAA